MYVHNLSEDVSQQLDRAEQSSSLEKVIGAFNLMLTKKMVLLSNWMQITLAQEGQDHWQKKEDWLNTGTKLRPNNEPRFQVGLN